MYTWILGTLGFGLCFLYDCNSIRWHHRLLHYSFGLGFGLIGTATALELAQAIGAGAIGTFMDWVWLALAALSLAALIYCLFFALPFSDTYQAPEAGRSVCRQGVYALCRHPGWFPFFFTYMFLGLAALPGQLLYLGLLLSFWNLLYIWFQDRVSFPRTFCDYQDYRACVPFLIPTKDSMRQAIRTGKKDSL